jgi:hypothetical protein
LGRRDSSSPEPAPLELTTALKAGLNRFLFKATVKYGNF